MRRAVKADRGRVAAHVPGEDLPQRRVPRGARGRAHGPHVDHVAVRHAIEGNTRPRRILGDTSTLPRVPDSEKLDVPQAIDRLNRALALQYRSALQYAMLAGGITGFTHQALREPLAEAAGAELEDVRLLVEKVTALGGDPTTQVAEIRWQTEPEAAVDRLMEDEGEAIEALQEAIEPTGREGVSEALEHLLEHVILRKQRQVDLLLRARRGS